MRAFKVIKNPEAIELIGDETRRRMIYLLRARELTISQIAEELEKTPQAIYHHSRKLLDAGMIEVAREERIENFIETYYRATAEVFEFSYGEGSSQVYAEQRLKDALQSLDKLGINVKVDEAIVSKIIEVKKRLEAIGARPELEEKAARLEGVDFIGKQEMTGYAKMILMTDKQFEAWLQLHKEFRILLRRLLSLSKAVVSRSRSSSP